MKCIKNKCELMKRSDGNGVGVRGLKGVMVMMEV